MSHYVDINTKITDKKALVKALERMGFQDHVEQYNTPTNLYGYHGDIRSQKADVIVRRKYVGKLSNDIGFERAEDGFYRSHISEYDESIGYNSDWTKKLFTYYGVECAKQNADREGLSYTEEIDDQDRIRLRVSF